MVPGSIDVVCFPESFLHAGLAYQHISEVEHEYEPATKHARKWARYLRANIVLPVICCEGGRYTNSILTFSRKGSLVGRYDKQHPWPSCLDPVEFEKGITPGRGNGIVKVDFGCFGLQTCFDVNWPEGWEAFRGHRPKFVLFPSEYGAGFALNARAWQIRTPIVAVILGGKCRVIDITGTEITRTSCKEFAHISVVTLNSNKALIHLDHNESAIRRLKSENPSIKLTRLRNDNVVLVEAPATGRELRRVFRECGVRELDEYLAGVHEIINAN